MLQLAAREGIYPVSREFWRDWMARHPGATYFHTPLWADTLEAAFGHQSTVRYFRHGDEEALIPLTLRRVCKGLLHWTVSGETGVYAGPVAKGPLSESARGALWRALTEEYPNLTVFGNPFQPQPLAEGTRETTHVLAMAHWRQGLSRGCRARCNKAHRLGLDLLVAQQAEDARLFYPIYADTLRRWGTHATWVRPLRFFEALAAKSCGHVRLLLAEKDGELVAGVWTATYGGMAHYLAGATRLDALEACPSNFLLEAALEMAEQDGCHTFDFGPSGGLSGVIRFKESFGAKPSAFGRWQQHDWRLRTYLRLKR